jgi:orotate phosphoribosyltransferase
MKARLLSLLKEHSYKEGSFVLASGKKSEYFIDCKQTLLLAEGHWLAANLIMDTISDLLNTLKIEIHAVAGVALGGCSLTSAVATYSYELGSEFITKMGCNPFPIFDALYIRKEPKDHGTKNLIEGNIKPGANIVLLEDTITSGGSSINALGELKAAGYNSVAVIAVVDRLEGGKENINDKFGVPVISLFTIGDFR